MTSCDEVRGVLRSYYGLFPEETARHVGLASQLSAGDDVLVRSNMTGHVTCSAIVLNRSGTKVLLIHHKVLDKWLQPGGHYEAPGSLWASALREVAEETGARDIEPHRWTKFNGGLPIDVDTHPIPANPKKNEGAHWHHDFRFLVVGNEAEPLLAQAEEVHSARWAPLSALRDSLGGRERVLCGKVERLSDFDSLALRCNP